MENGITIRSIREIFR